MSQSALCCLTPVVVASIKRRPAAVLRGVEALLKHDAALLVTGLGRQHTAPASAAWPCSVESSPITVAI